MRCRYEAISCCFCKFMPLSLRNSLSAEASTSLRQFLVNLGPRVPQKHFKVRLIPLTRLRRRLERLHEPADWVETRRRLIARPVRYTTTFYPNKSICQRQPNLLLIRSRTLPEPCAINVAPAAPVHAESLDAVPACVHDGVIGRSGGIEQITKEGYKGSFILGSIAHCLAAGGELAWRKVPVLQGRRCQYCRMERR